MASISDRWHITDRATGRKTRSARYGTGKRWQVRYRDPAGQSRNRSFDRKSDAERFQVELAGRLLQGSYVDRNRGRIPFGEYASAWLRRQLFSETSRAAVEMRFRVHVLPTWADVPLVNIRPVDVQDWLITLSRTLSPGYVRLIFVNFGAALAAAVEEGLLDSNPVRSRLVKLPKSQPRQVQPWEAARVEAVLDQLPAEVRALGVVAATCGLRQGECFGLRRQDVDFDRAEIRVHQQITLQAGLPLPALPKYQRTRIVPATTWVLEELAAHLDRQEPLEGALSTGPSLGGLLFYSRHRKPLNKNYFNTHVWRPALDAAGVPRGRANGMHALRHTCASMWLEGGVSIKAVSEYLGHADPGFTLRVYTHVMPSSGDRARMAMEAAFGQGRRPAEAAPIAGAPSAHETTASGGR